MGQLVFAAKVTHIPRMVLSELPGPLHGCRDDAIQGLQSDLQAILGSAQESLVGDSKQTRRPDVLQR